MQVIRSAANPRIQNARRLLKAQDAGMFLIEGVKLFQEAFRSGIEFVEVFVTQEYWQTQRDLMDQLQRKRTAVQLVAPNVLRTLSEVESPPGLLGLARKRTSSAPASLLTYAILLLSIRDPGNFGTILRSAEGFGCEWLAHTSDCVDPFNPKVVRAAMGSLFRLKLVEVKDVNRFLKEQLKKGIQVFGLDARGEIQIHSWKPAYPFLVCIGSESHGIPAETPLTARVTIPIKEEVESLNAAVAAGISMFWLSKQAN